jgi:hypothetical protein
MHYGIMYFNVLAQLLLSSFVIKDNNYIYDYKYVITLTCMKISFYKIMTLYHAV